MAGNLVPVSLTYASLLRELDESRAQLRGVPLPPGGAPTVEWLKQRCELETHAADAACEEFALRRRWPAMRVDSVVAQVHLRVGAAMALCRQLGVQQLPTGLEAREALRRLLLDYWHEHLGRVVAHPSRRAAGCSAGTTPLQGDGFPYVSGPGFNLTVAQ